MIQIIPAIDLIDGRCVRLSQGDFSRKAEYGASPVDMARRFEDAGVSRIHLVDLDGAREGRPCNLRTLEKIASACSVETEWGGGIKTAADIESAFSAGAGEIICGTVAVKSPELFQQWLDRYGKLILGADVRGRKVSTDGWLKDSDTDIFSLAGSFSGLREVIATQIDRDGMLGGPDIELYKELCARFPSMTFIASGGVGSMADIEALDEAGVPRAIVGKAIYENRISLKEIESWCARG